MARQPRTGKIMAIQLSLLPFTAFHCRTLFSHCISVPFIVLSLPFSLRPLLFPLALFTAFPSVPTALRTAFPYIPTAFQHRLIQHRSQQVPRFRPARRGQVPPPRRDSKSTHQPNVLLELTWWADFECWVCSQAAAPARCSEDRSQWESSGGRRRRRSRTRSRRRRRRGRAAEAQLRAIPWRPIILCA